MESEEDNVILVKAKQFGFDDRVFNSLKDSGIVLGDLPLTAEEINCEFPNLAFGVRKKLKIFLGSLLESELESEVDLEESFTSHSSDSTFPLSNEEGDGLNQRFDKSQPDYKPSGKKRKRHFQKFFIKSPSSEIAGSSANSSFNVVYPEGIPYPFPLETTYSNYLQKVTKADFAKNYSAYCAVIRNIYDVIHTRIGKPSKSDRDEISLGLVKEYPVLATAEEPSYAVLSTSIRKRANNFSQFVRSVVEEKPPQKKIRTSSVSAATSSPPLDQDQDGWKQLIFSCSVKEFFEKCPQFAAHNKCIEEFEKLPDVSKREESRKQWNVLMENGRHKLNLADSSDFTVFHRIVQNLCVNDNHSKQIITFGELGDVSTSSTQKNQPYLLSTGNSSEPGQMCLVVEQCVVVALNGVDMLDCYATLIAVYYLFNLEYPSLCKSVYKCLTDFLFFNMPVRSKKLIDLLKK